VLAGADWTPNQLPKPSGLDRFEAEWSEGVNRTLHHPVHAVAETKELCVAQRRGEINSDFSGRLTHKNGDFLSIKR
jgi:hypothetical protein